MDRPETSERLSEAVQTLLGPLGLMANSISGAFPSSSLPARLAGWRLCELEAVNEAAPDWMMLADMSPRSVDPDLTWRSYSSDHDLHDMKLRGSPLLPVHVSRRSSMTFGHLRKYCLANLWRRSDATIQVYAYPISITSPHPSAALGVRQVLEQVDTPRAHCCWLGCAPRAGRITLHA